MHGNGGMNVHLHLSVFWQKTLVFWHEKNSLKRYNLIINPGRRKENRE